MLCSNDTKNPLQERYEEILGKEISERQLRRICRDYLKGQVNLRTVRSLALLRKANGRRHLNIEDLERQAGLIQFAEGIEGYVKGSDLMASFRKLNPRPSDRTIRRWGDEIGVPLRLNEWYSPEQVQLWIRKLASQTRFKFPQQQKGA